VLPRAEHPVSFRVRDSVFEQIAKFVETNCQPQQLRFLLIKKVFQRLSDFEDVAFPVIFMGIDNPAPANRS
jgi:hypothetical protein